MFYYQGLISDERLDITFKYMLTMFEDSKQAQGNPFLTFGICLECRSWSLVHLALCEKILFDETKRISRLFSG